MAVRMTAFSLTLMLVPVLALAWVRWVWQEAKDPGVSPVELACRTGLIVAAGLLAYLALRLLGAAVSAIARGLEDLDRRSHPWRW
jgi:Zn-dependent protease with chaperone function